jgi:dihydrodipicolinate synthase/N-acetylneuraminate lyase
MSSGTLYRGVVVPMVSPFTPISRIDWAAVERIVAYLLGHGVAGIFPLGTTGESASIHPREKVLLVENTMRSVAGRAMVYAGISGNCFRESVEFAQTYKKLGVDAAVAHVCSYYPLSDVEIEEYFLRLADEIPLPLVLYNIPATTHHSISLDSIDRLKAHPNIVALKDSAGDAQRLTELLKRTGGREGFPVLIGNSSLFTLGLKLGGTGLVPSGAHLAAELYQFMYTAAMEEQWNIVEQMQQETDIICARYIKGRSLGQGLAALKALLEERGICGRTMLPPLLDYKGTP